MLIEAVTGDRVESAPVVVRAEMRNFRQLLRMRDDASNTVVRAMMERRRV